MVRPQFFLLTLIGTLALGGAWNCATSQTSVLYTLGQAIDKGVVDINFNPRYELPIGPIIDHLADLDPGIVNRFGFRYGGPDVNFLAQQKILLTKIRTVLPHALMGAAFPQDVFADYNISLDCNNTKRTFTASSMMSVPATVPHFVMLDMSIRETQDFEICLGKIFVDQGFTFLQLEGMGGIIPHSRSREGAIAGYHLIQDTVRKYGETRGVKLYFSSYWSFARGFHLDALYEPARFFHTSIPEWLQYQEKVVTPGLGNGYTYALSPKIIRDRVAAVPAYTHVMFYIDNWDASQDDLRRLMELDAASRREMLLRSAENAAAGGAYFIPSLYHCNGCVKPEGVGDRCEILPDGSTQYDAYTCGDWATIKSVLSIESHGQKH